MDQIINAIESGSIDDIQNHITSLKEFNHDTLTSLLQHSPSDEVTTVIKKIFHTRMADADGSVENSSAACCGAENENNNQPESPKGRDTDSSSNNVSEDLNEDQAVKKYSKKNSKIDKAVQMFLAAFKTNIKKINYDKSVFLCFEIANYIFEKKNDSFPKIVRSKSHNLKENVKLCEDVYCGRVDPSKFVEMSASDMKSDELKNKDEVAIKDGLLASQVAKVAAETDMFRCSRCKERKCTYSQLQTRSCDEPMTTFVHCTVCGNRWRF